MVVNKSSTTNSIGFAWENNKKLSAYIDTTCIGHFLRCKTLSVTDSLTLSANQQSDTIYNLTELGSLSGLSIYSIQCISSWTTGTDMLDLHIIDSSSGFLCRPKNNSNSSFTVSLYCMVIYN